jgi:hypothetical protein
MTDPQILLFYDEAERLLGTPTALYQFCKLIDANPSEGTYQLVAIRAAVFLGKHRNRRSRGATFREAEPQRQSWTLVAARQ